MAVRPAVHLDLSKSPAKPVIGATVGFAQGGYSGQIMVKPHTAYTDFNASWALVGTNIANNTITIDFKAPSNTKVASIAMGTRILEIKMAQSGAYSIASGFQYKAWYEDSTCNVAHLILVYTAGITGLLPGDIYATSVAV
jgi:hypothetical protein